MKFFALINGHHLSTLEKHLKLKPCILYNNKYMIPSTKTVREFNILASKQITNSVIATLLLRDSGTDVFL